MLIAFISGLIMLALFDRALRHGRIATAQLTAKFELCAIRDDLRRLERKGEVCPDAWFGYLDTTLTLSAVSIKRLTIWHALVYMSVADMRRIEEASEERERAMGERPTLAVLQKRYENCLRTLIRHRHALLWRILSVVAHVLSAASKYKSQVLKALSGSPETSTLLEYAFR
jgi:hypothetical protein